MFLIRHLCNYLTSWWRAFNRDTNSLHLWQHSPDGSLFSRIWTHFTPGTYSQYLHDLPFSFHLFSNSSHVFLLKACRIVWCRVNPVLMRNEIKHQACPVPLHQPSPGILQGTSTSEKLQGASSPGSIRCQETLEPLLTVLKKDCLNQKSPFIPQSFRQQTLSESLAVLQSLLQLPETELWTKQAESCPGGFTVLGVRQLFLNNHLHKFSQY